MIELQPSFLVPGYAVTLRQGEHSGACVACTLKMIDARWTSRRVPLDSSEYASRVLRQLEAAALDDRLGDKHTVMYEYEFATGHTRREWVPPNSSCTSCRSGETPRDVQLLGVDVIEVFTAGAESRFFFKTVTGQRLAGKDVQSSGAGPTKEIAEIKTLGEYLERSASVFPADSRVFGTYRDLDLESPHPSEYAIYSDDQYHDPALGYEPFTEDSKISWARATNLATQKQTYVPAQFCTFPYACDAPGEQYLSQWTTTGISFGPDVDFATEGSLLEVLERDALSISWLNRRRCRQIVETPFDAEHPPGWDIRYYDATVDIRVPVVIGITINVNDNAPLLTMSTGCAIDPHKALEKAHNEMLMCIEHAHLVRLYRKPVTSISEIRTFEDHSAYYAFGKRALLDPLDFFITNPERVAYEQWKSEPWLTSLDELVTTLDAAGLAPITIDLTPSWMRGTGSIIRAVIPGMQAIHADHRLPFLGGKRLQSVPQALGFNAFNVSKGLVPHALP